MSIIDFDYPNGINDEIMGDRKGGNRIGKWLGGGVFSWFIAEA